MLAEYQQAPEVTRRRLYLEAMEDIYANSSKVLVDTGKSNNLIYLPIDKILEQRRQPAASGETASVPIPAPAAKAAADASAATRDREDRRTREAR